MNSIYHAGEPIRAGSFGCVFRPALSCEGTNTREKTHISKLMYTRYAKEEHAEITKFAPIIKSLPNYKKYFIIDNIIYCKPNSLSKTTDLVNFDKKCNNFVKKGINAANINNPSNLSKLRLLTFIDGGIDLDFFMAKLLSNNTLKLVINGCIKLLNNAIIPMNKQNLYHYDVKGGNMLIDNDNNLRLIDWGLAGISAPNNIPNIIKFRPITYNNPYSGLFINDLFKRDYKIFLDQYKTNYKKHINRFVYQFYDKMLVQRGQGHHEYVITQFKTLNQIMPLTNNHAAETQRTGLAIIYDYLINTLLYFTDENGFDETKFMEVFNHNCDIWGLLMTFESIIYYHIKKTKNITISNEAKVVKLIAKMQWDYCYSNPTKKISVPALINNFRQVKNLISMDKPPIKTIKKKKKLVLVSSNGTRSLLKDLKPHIVTNSKSTITPKTTRKRCPNGTLRNKLTGNCDPIKKSIKSTVKKLKANRCPNRTRRNKKTGRCVPK